VTLNRYLPTTWRRQIRHVRICSWQSHQATKCRFWAYQPYFPMGKSPSSVRIRGRTSHILSPSGAGAQRGQLPVTSSVRKLEIYAWTNCDAAGILAHQNESLCWSQVVESEDAQVKRNPRKLLSFVDCFISFVDRLNSSTVCNSSIDIQLNG
jgi:hypothetical protein